MSAVEDNVASVSSLTDLKYSLISFVYVSGTPKLRFSYDDKVEASAIPTAISDIPLTDAKYGVDGTSDVTIKVEFTKDGDIAISYNGEKLIDVTGQTIYGKQLGIIPTNRGPLSGKVGQVAGTVNSFEIEAPATEPDNGNQGGGNQGSVPDTGDALSVYLAVSAVALCATFAVALTSRKKIEE